MCTLSANLYMLLTYGPHMVYHAWGPIYISYLYDHNGWLGTCIECMCSVNCWLSVQYTYTAIKYCIQYTLLYMLLITLYYM